MLHLFVPFYVDAREPRRKEIEDTVRRNLHRTEFDSVTLFCEPKEAPPATARLYKAVLKLDQAWLDRHRGML